MPETKNPVLWENNEFIIRTPSNPHVPYSEGLHLYIAAKNEIANAWEDPELAAETFRFASKACKLMEEHEFAPWFNIQANGNWGLLPGTEPYFHIHIYGRNKTDTWGKAIILPIAPGTYNNHPMPENDRIALPELFKSL